ncbi:hypothetical protein AWB78_06952 [Caballeronia calidae]|uniref:Uncharacterized protein n=1 Tax=Caballeronia calidae TaxID=1777139 RepID=A0A158EDE1_9BURK|nr:hypothetical protein AWB78_06952 [Caballeronia calidae]
MREFGTVQWLDVLREARALGEAQYIDTMGSVVEIVYLSIDN